MEERYYLGLQDRTRISRNNIAIRFVSKRVPSLLELGVKNMPVHPQWTRNGSDRTRDESPPCYISRLRVA